MRYKTAHLSTRLFVASAIVLPILLGFSAFMLDLAFRKSLVAAEQDRLNGQIYLLLAAADLVDNKLLLPEQLTEPLFGQLNSGLYAFIVDVEGGEIWRSLSAGVLGIEIEQETEIDPGSIQFKPYILNGREYYLFSFDVAYEKEDGASELFRFSVLHLQQGIQSELFAYRKQLWWLLGGLAFLLLITQAWIMRWGLRPLEVVARDLKVVEQGKAATLEGSYPGEIQPVVENLNRVLKTERTQRERYKNTLSDLAHSLKTPLAILRGTLEQPTENVKRQVDEQITRMDQIISHQLQRAVIGNQSQAGQQIDVLKLVRRIGDALAKAYQDKKIDLDIVAEQVSYFYGAESDLMEVLGNILDNAYKYCDGRVLVSISSDNKELKICMADDGSGVDDLSKEQILQRGARADTVQPGQGLGLAIATDIISSYKGGLSVTRSKLGGAEFIVVLPYLPT